MLFTAEQSQTLLIMFISSFALTIVSIISYLSNNMSEEINMKSSFVPIFMALLTIILGVSLYIAA